MANNHERFPDPFPTNAERRDRAERSLWEILGRLYRRRRFILAFTGGVAVLAVVISLLIDNWYRAETRLMLPARSGAGLVSAAVLDNLPTAAKSILGGASGDYARYLTVLTSRSIYEAVVDSFDLVRVYETHESKTPRPDAVRILQDNAEFLLDDEYEFLTVAVTDTDPQRAADLANYFVRKLNEINAQLSAQSARNFRVFVEDRYNKTVAELDSVMQAGRAFQEKYGVLDLPKQGEQFFEYMAQLRLAAIQAEGEYETLLSQFGPQHSLVQGAREAARAANRKYQGALAGREQLLPVPRQALPEVSVGYLELERERLILATLLEYIRPVLEEARFDEERTVEAVQVVDVAVPPARKAGPRRSVICIAATLSAFLLAVLFALAHTWWQRHHVYFAHRLREAAGEAAPAPSDPPSSEPVTSA